MWRCARFGRFDTVDCAHDIRQGNAGAL